MYSSFRCPWISRVVMPTGVQRDHLLIEPRQPALALPHKLRLERRVPVPRHLDFMISSGLRPSSKRSRSSFTSCSLRSFFLAMVSSRFRSLLHGHLHRNQHTPLNRLRYLPIPLPFPKHLKIPVLTHRHIVAVQYIAHILRTRESIQYDHTHILP